MSRQLLLYAHTHTYILPQTMPTAAAAGSALNLNTDAAPTSVQVLTRSFDLLFYVTYPQLHAQLLVCVEYHILQVRPDLQDLHGLVKHDKSQT